MIYWVDNDERNGEMCRECTTGREAKKLSGA
jgi:hypothetical protein